MDLVNRLKFYMECRNIAISQFADTCLIPRPTMSQILNGRNKKISDELISKIHNAYPELSVLWLMFGEGEMLTTENKESSEPKTVAFTPDSNIQSTTNQLIDTEISPKSTDIKFDSEKTIGPEISYSSVYNKNLHPDSHPDANPSQNIFQHTNANTSPNDLFSKASPDMPVIDFGEASTNKSSANNMHGLNIADDDERHTYATQQINNNADKESDIQSAESAQNTTNTQSIKEVTPGVGTPTNTSGETTVPLNDRTTLSLHTSPNKRITNIVVFYSDNSFQSFSPS